MFIYKTTTTAREIPYFTNYLFINVENQMGAVETGFDEVTNIFDTGGSKGLPGDSVEKIPKITITSNNNVDASGERVSCSVCLQVQPQFSSFSHLIF